MIDGFAAEYYDKRQQNQVQPVFHTTVVPKKSVVKVYFPEMERSWNNMVSNFIDNKR